MKSGARFTEVKALKKAFTLIELLVVISIISLLSAVIISSVAEARDKARIAKALVFEHSVKTALINDLVGEWTFDEFAEGASVTSAITIQDTSGNNLVGSVSGTHTAVEGVNSGTAIDFSGNGYINIPDNNLLDFADATSDYDEFSISLWFNHQVAGGVVLFGKNHNTSYYARLNNAANEIAFYTNNHITLVNKSYDLNKWHHLLFTYKNNTKKVYMDGVLVRTSSGASLTADTSPFRIASSPSYGVHFNGIIDNVRIYSAALE